MAEKWEICVIHEGALKVEFYKPGEKTRAGNFGEFIKQKGDTPGFINNFDKVVSLVLDEGWEPYAVLDRVMYFRRKKSTE